MIAYRLFRAGKHLQKIRPGREGLLIPTGVKDGEEEIFIKAGDVLSYFTEEFWNAYEFFATSEVLGVPPFSGGWTTWPAIAMQTLLLFKTEANRWENKELKKRTRGGGRDD
jgi:hypothetical protein